MLSGAYDATPRTGHILVATRQDHMEPPCARSLPLGSPTAKAAHAKRREGFPAPFVTHILETYFSRLCVFLIGGQVQIRFAGRAMPLSDRGWDRRPVFVRRRGSTGGKHPVAWCRAIPIRRPRSSTVCGAFLSALFSRGHVSVFAFARISSPIASIAFADVSSSALVSDSVAFTIKRAADREAHRGPREARRQSDVGHVIHRHACAFLDGRTTKKYILCATRPVALCTAPPNRPFERLAM